MTRQEAITKADRILESAKQKLKHRYEELLVIRARRDDPYWARGWYDQYPYAQELVYDAAEEVAHAYCLFVDATLAPLDAELEDKLS